MNQLHVVLEIVHFVYVHGERFKMSRNVKIKINDVKKDIDKEYSKNVKKNLSKIQRILDDKIEQIVLQRLLSGLPTVQGNDLAEIGVPDINTRLASIVQTIARNVRVKISGTKRITVDITIFEEDYSDVDEEMMEVPHGDVKVKVMKLDGGNVQDMMNKLLGGH